VAWETARPPVIGKEGGTVKRSRLLTYISIALIAAGAVLLVISFTITSDHATVTTSQVKSMPRVRGEYRSINNWKTVQTFQFDGTPFTELLARAGVTNPTATVRVIAPDGYFWPEVGKKLTIKDLALKNKQGLTRIVAYASKGKDLDPEPDGTGPLRYVSPQYKPTDVNKPSWVSNVRLIEVGPLAKGYKGPSGKKVPTDQVWLYGKVSGDKVVPVWIPLVVMGAGLLLLTVSIGMFFLERRKRTAATGVAGGLALVALLVVSLAAGSVGLGTRRAEASGSFSFTVAQLKAMPATTAHYTFLKQLPPYTYYEADYRGVTLPALLQSQLVTDTGAIKVVVKATDGYAVTLTLAEALATYANNLQCMVAYARGDGSSLADDEGPLKLIVPQTHPGKKDSGGDPNTPKCARMVVSMEVDPLAGVSQPSAASGSFAVFGSVSQPAPAPAPTPTPTPAPAPTPTPTPTPTPAPVATAPQAAAQPQVTATAGKWDHAAVAALFGGAGGLARMISGVSVSMFLPGPAGVALRRLFFTLGSGR
jgi:DMSO/TMAO reductase YedYZ molybdopterin-dependent catalytic subunit